MKVYGLTSTGVSGGARLLSPGGPSTSAGTPADAADSVLPLYDLMFGERDPVEQPGTAAGTPGNWWTVFALSSRRA